MNIFFREMKALRKSLIIWCIGVFLLVASGMGKYSAAAGGQSMNDIVARMPKSVQTIMGMSGFDLSKAIGYFGMLFLYLAVMAAIHAAMLGANIIAKEERDKTSEFLFAKPVSRYRVITSKLLAALTNILVFNIVTLVSSILMVGYYSKGEAVTGVILKLMIGMLMLQLIFLAVGTGIAAVSKRPKGAPAAAAAVMLVAFVLDRAIDLNKNLEFLKYITPFKYFEAGALMYGGGFDPVFVILSAAIIAVLVGMTYVFYKKRDLNV